MVVMRAGSEFKTPPKSVDEYLERVPEPGRTTLQKVRQTIQSLVPEGTTEVISYQLPCFKYKGMLLAIGAFQNHCSLFAMNPAVQVMFEKELKPYKTSKGTIQFALDKPLPKGLIAKLVKARVAQIEAKKK
jgi:uncharacterized protein YdhG (YjbR/CyaY superfamily)